MDVATNKSDNLAQVASDLNQVAVFLAANDFENLQLNQETVQRAVGAPAADVLVLLGNSVLHTSESAFVAMRRGIAHRLLISGGKGHSTELLYEALAKHPRYHEISIHGQSEAELLSTVATCFYDIDPAVVLLETKSSSCGENAEFTHRTLSANAIMPGTVILVQDPTMQRRSAAAFCKVWREAGKPLRSANYPAFIPVVRAVGKTLLFAGPHADGLWSMERFVALVLGEIVRLRDDIHGYGPRGRGFIDHVDIPPPVAAAHRRLAECFPDLVR